MIALLFFLAAYLLFFYGQRFLSKRSSWPVFGPRWLLLPARPWHRLMEDPGDGRALLRTVGGDPEALAARLESEGHHLQGLEERAQTAEEGYLSLLRAVKQI